jgi:hypothetical protein
MSSKTLIVGTLALAGVLSAGLAQARDYNDVQWSVSIGVPIGVPLYSQPYPVYSQPFSADPRHHYQVRQYVQPTLWDRDGDGIANRYDRVYNPHWDRDGDGIPNRQDRNNQARNDRDGDGIPNWQDRNDGRRGR